ncbi:ribonuclease H-like domain-containing protein [Tanacetum coccineum]
MSHLHPKGNFVPKTVLMKSGLKTLNTARQASNVFIRAHSHVRRPFNKFATVKNSNFNEKVNNVKGNVTTIGTKEVVIEIKGYEANCVKASAVEIHNYEEINEGFVAFGGSTKGGKITGKGIENLIDLKVKVIRCDNGTEFKNKVMNQFCEMKGIKREFSVARTPQQNGVAERKHWTLIEAARNMLANSKLPTTF